MMKNKKEKKNTKNKKEKKKIRKLILTTITQNNLVNVVEEAAKKKSPLSNAPSPRTVWLPSELIAKIISLLRVKTILRLKCVSKSWYSLISDLTFVQEHLKASSKFPRLILTPGNFNNVLSIPVLHLISYPSITYDIWRSWVNNFEVVGTCKGLFCLLFHNRYQKYWFCLWNPATRKISKELGTFNDYKTLPRSYKFSFGCDISTGTYKVVAYQKLEDEQNQGSWTSKVKIFSLSDNCWRNIESFPSNPCISNNRINVTDGVHLSGTVNWLALNNYSKCFVYYYKDITYVEQFTIVSLDLSTETYTQFLLPSGFDKVPHFRPTLHVLIDCLCFAHDFKGIEFVIWQMKEFGVQESWTQLFRTDYFNLDMYDVQTDYGNDIFGWDSPLLPLYLSKDGNTLILAKYKDDVGIIYNHRDKRVDIIKITKRLSWISAMDYVESLVSTPCMSATLTPAISSSVVGIGSIAGHSSEEDTE